MVLQIEDVSGATFAGYVKWPSLKNSTTSMNGRFVDDFGDFVEQSKWQYVKGFGTVESGEWVIFTETDLIQGGNITLNGLYYAHAGEDGTMNGVWFADSERSEPGGSFTITAQC